MDSNSQSISRIGRDLMERETIVHDDIGSIVDIAVDWIAGMLLSSMLMSVEAFRTDVIVFIGDIIIER
jgi:hypothetical protein